ncbi:MAG: hypothetical protein K9K21_08635 [Desulfotignum sp.]|nr:hypothetical protein [Desulfotignum sp.]MCF8113899.1 hypothetical protein [Desulfotignum sp.]MCF8125711.1 hypothetical protein [Desulfotignum sp.]
MKQKIRFEKNVKDGTLTILESSEVDPGVMMPLHEEKYDLAQITAAALEGLETFTRMLRRRTFFPTRDLCVKLHEETREFFKDDAIDKAVVEFHDSETLPDEEEFQLEDEDVELDALLDEDGDSKEDEIKEIDDEDDTPRFTPEDTSEHEN